MIILIVLVTVAISIIILIIMIVLIINRMSGARSLLRGPDALSNQCSLHLVSPQAPFYNQGIINRTSLFMRY